MTNLFSWEELGIKLNGKEEVFKVCLGAPLIKRP